MVSKVSSVERKEVRLAAGQNRVNPSSAADARGAIFVGYGFGGFRAPPYSVVDWVLTESTSPFC